DLLGEDSKLNELCGGRVEVSIEDLIARRAPQFGKRPQTGRFRYDTGMTASNREIAEQEGWRDFQHEGSGPNTSSFTRTGGCGWERGWKAHLRYNRIRCRVRRNLHRRSLNGIGTPCQRPILTLAESGL